MGNRIGTRTRPHFLFEDEMGGIVAGVDEVGRGPLAGPVLAAAVIIPLAVRGYDFVSQLNDSKLVPPILREELAQQIQTHCWIGIGAASVKEIDSLNILRASFLAMQRALKRLPISPEFILVDGALRIPQLERPCIPIVKGDRQSKSIAAASILAKVVRDRTMEKLGIRYPSYNWGGNKGYATGDHKELLVNCGISPHHRRSFSRNKESRQGELWSSL